ncbi:MAG TPA: M1 family aminopeptidase [Patescibacteria group bacterium]|nr:M1 family aminopeptidase [Patescibacteria group bacterium]
MKFQTVTRAIIFFLLLTFVFSMAVLAQEPPSAWQTEYIDLAVTLEPGRGVMRVEAGLLLNNPGVDNEDILLTLNHQLQVESVTDESGRSLAFKQIGDSFAVHPPEQPPEQKTCAIHVRYRGSFHERLPELDLLNAWIGPRIAYAFHSSRWYPQTLEIRRRSRGRITFLVPKEWTVASSGRLTATEILPAAKRCTFAVATPVEFSFAAAEFVHHREKIDGLELGIFFLKGERNKIDFYLKKCSELIGYYKDCYGFFPYDGYNLIELPQALLGKTGAASYEGLTFFPEALLPERFFYAPVFAHEISHCWWGNCVRGAEGPVINEGLAQISMGLYIKKTRGRKFFWNMLKDGAPEYLSMHSARLFFQALKLSKIKDDSLEALLMRGEDLELGIPAKDKFTTLHMLSSSKGFFIYAMLRELIGPEAFQQGLRGALKQFAWKIMTLEDLRAQFEKAGGRNLQWFFEQWFMRKGAPEFAINCWYAEHSKNWLVQVMITQLRDVYRVKAEIGFIKGAFCEIREIEINACETKFSFLLPFKPQNVRFDPDYKILRWSEQF